jgi:uncharacterized damage-inducible protein DinB
MITTEYLRLMARYNAWQNASLYGAAETLTDEARKSDRGAFWRSIHGTLSHVFWGDSVWAHRLGGYPAVTVGIKGSGSFVEAWADLAARRRALDEELKVWMGRLTEADLAGDVSWNSAALGRAVTKPKALLLAHMFNHQTHHRGQAHAMLTAAGAKPEDTDLPFMPEGW